MNEAPTSRPRLILARVLGVALTVFGGGGALVFGVMADGGFHGASWPELWPLLAITAWLGVCGLGLCLRWRGTRRATQAWGAVAIASLLGMVFLSVDDVPWGFVAGVALVIAFVVACVSQLTREPEATP
jgi:peptidoglycan/LPS O-acetylase OafA/YrhL